MSKMKGEVYLAEKYYMYLKTVNLSFLCNSLCFLSARLKYKKGVVFLIMILEPSQVFGPQVVDLCFQHLACLKLQTSGMGRRFSWAWDMIKH